MLLMAHTHSSPFIMKKVCRNRLRGLNHINASVETTCERCAELTLAVRCAQVDYLEIFTLCGSILYALAGMLFYSSITEMVAYPRAFVSCARSRPDTRAVSARRKASCVSKTKRTATRATLRLSSSSSSP